MGAGGVGGYLGAKLARGGHDVALIARGAHLEALRRHGLRISGAESLEVPGLLATDRPVDIGPVDAVLFCVKLYDTEAAARLLRPLLGEGGLVATVQNGVESAARIAAVIGPGRTLAGAAYFPANIAAPGEIAWLGRMQGRPLVGCGEPGGGPSPRARAFAQACNEAGVEAEVFDDTERMLWEKFCLIAGSSAATSLTRQPIGPVCSDPDARWVLAQAVGEAAAVGRACGVALAEDIEQRVLGFLASGPANGKSSQLVDLERGRRLELEWLSGTVARLGREHGIPTPIHRAVYAALKPYASGTPDGA
jgi:2-dehydropantoate 2-reductase